MKRLGAGLLLILFALSPAVWAQLVNPAQKKADQVKKLEIIEPTSIKLNRTEVYVFYNRGLVTASKEGYKLVATILPENATNKNVIWESSDPTVVEVSKDGYLTPNKLGSAVITATAQANGIKAQCRVYVQRRNHPFGNTVSNLNNLGYLAVQNDWIYFANPSFGMGLYKMKLDGSEKQMVLKNTIYHTGCINVIGNQIYYLASGSWVHKVDIYGENLKVLNPALAAIHILAVPGRVFHLSERPNTGYGVYYVDTEGMNRNVLDWEFPQSIWRIAGIDDWFVFADGRGDIYYIRKINNTQWSEPDKISGEGQWNFVLETFSVGDYVDAAVSPAFVYVIDYKMNSIKKIGPVGDKKKRKTEVLFRSQGQEPIKGLAESEDWLFYSTEGVLSKIKKDGTQNQIIDNRLPAGQHFLFPVRTGNNPNDLWIYVYTLDANKKFSLFKIRHDGMGKTNI